MKRMTLCADDFGQGLEISQGILELLDMGRLQALSCMTESPHWPAGAAALKERQGDHQVGLHFNLTHGFGVPARPIDEMMTDAWLRRISRTEVARRFDAQLDAFTREMGRLPDYVDGHQHVHVFPVIREVVAERVQARAPEAWVRSLKGLVRSSKAALLTWASRALVRQLKLRSLKTNARFGGLRPYRTGFDFREAFRESLRRNPEGTLLMCHPGVESNDPEDPIADYRLLEFRYLVSEDFENDSREMQVEFRKLIPRPA